MKRLLAGLLLLVTATCTAGDAELRREPSLILPKPTVTGDLFRYAIELGGYTEFCKKRWGGCPQPAIIIQPQAEGIAGSFNYDSPQAINVSDTVDQPGTLDWNEVVVHEYTHYLQWLSGKYSPARDDVCKMMFEIESEAYVTGHAYLALFGVVKDTQRTIAWLNFNYVMCEMARASGG